MFLAKNRGQEVPLLVGYLLLIFASAIVRDLVITPYVTHHLSGIGARTHEETHEEETSEAATI